MTRRIMRWIGLAVVVTGYSLLAHYTNTFAHNDNLGALTSVAPVAFVALMLAWNSPRRLIMLGALALLCIALTTQWHAIAQHYGLIYWLQDTGMQLVLLATFGRTLITGRKPLCTRFAEMVHSPLTPQHEIYARHVTVAWTLFFAAMAATSALLFFLTPLSTWSIFANFLMLPLTATMFIAEYWVRRWRLPDVQNVHLLDAVRAYRNTQSSRP